jgi:hypothetical protein
MKLIENQTVANLRKNGFKVKVQHQRFTSGLSIDGKTRYLEGMQLRPEYELRQMKLSFEPKGGFTKVSVTRLADKAEFIGESRCSESDTYNRKLGVSIALGRLDCLKSVKYLSKSQSFILPIHQQ